MRTSLALLALLVLVPSTALADDDAPPEADAPAPSPAARPATPMVRLAPNPAYAASPPADDGYITPQTVAYEGGDIPANAKLINKPNMYLVGTGIALLSASYFGSLLYGLATCSAQETCRPGSGYLYIPVIGPFFTAAYAPTTGGSALSAFAGGAQVLGVALAAAGFIWPRKFVMWQSKTSSVAIAPTAGTAAGPGDKQGVVAGLTVTVTNL